MTAHHPCGRFVVDVDSADASERRLVGGKAAGLRTLRAAGLPCPPALVVTTEAHGRYLRHAVGARDLATLVRQAHQDDDARQELLAAHARRGLPPEVSGPLDRAAAALPAPHGLAVRSSAVREDGRRLAFAGMYTSVLDVPAGDLDRAVRDCWASLWAPTALAYRHAAGADIGTDIGTDSHGGTAGRDTPGGDAAVPERMAVVVQPMLSAVAAAVVFTTDPVTDPDLVRVEVVRGAGAPLVAGEADPDVVLLDRVTLRTVEFRPAGSEQPGDGRDDRDDRDGPAVGEPQARHLADLCLRAERAFGVPLDVEAVLVGGAGEDARWTLVQARPITAAARVLPAPLHPYAR